MEDIRVYYLLKHYSQIKTIFLNFRFSKDSFLDKIIKSEDGSRKYKVLKLIGQGSFGKVYKAVNIENNEKFSFSQSCL